MIQEPALTNALFIFNDNTSGMDDQNNRDHGGNACTRPSAWKSPPRALGIPTGTLGAADWGNPGKRNGLDFIDSNVGMPARQIIDNAFESLYFLLNVRPEIDTVFFSREPDKPVRLGKSLFKFGDDVRDYITGKLLALEKGFKPLSAINSAAEKALPNRFALFKRLLPSAPASRNGGSTGKGTAPSKGVSATSAGPARDAELLLQRLEQWPSQEPLRMSAKDMGESTFHKLDCAAINPSLKAHAEILAKVLKVDAALELIPAGELRDGLADYLKLCNKARLFWTPWQNKSLLTSEFSVASHYCLLSIEHSDGSHGGGMLLRCWRAAGAVLIVQVVMCATEPTGAKRGRLALRALQLLVHREGKRLGVEWVVIFANAVYDKWDDDAKKVKSAIRFYEGVDFKGVERKGSFSDRLKGSQHAHDVSTMPIGHKATLDLSNLAPIPNVDQRMHPELRDWQRMEWTQKVCHSPQAFSGHGAHGPHILHSLLRRSGRHHHLHPPDQLSRYFPFLSSIQRSSLCT